jgi:flagellar hook assembly protein FlgD
LGADLPETTGLAILGPRTRSSVTEIRFALADAERRLVEIEIFDVAGRRLKRLVDDNLPGGRYGVTWNGTDGEGNRVGAGVYFVRMRAGTVTQVRKLVVIR